VTIGRVVRPHGIKGDVVVEPLTDNPRRFDDLPGQCGLRLVPVPLPVPDPGSRAGGGFAGVSNVRVERQFPHHGRRVLKFAGVNSRDAAELLRDRALQVPQGSVPALPEGSYYHFELQGLRAITASGRAIGVVESIWHTGGAAPVIVIRGERGAETLLPFVEPFVGTIDRTTGVVEVRVPDAVTDTDTPRKS
jgi:16S rRNA processing protein RimM